jgi:uncharacterized protein (DUF1015 family)
MAVVKPFRGLRPKKEVADRVASPPYDVISSTEARKMAENNPISFLHVNKPEIDLPETVNLYDPAVYAKGSENLKKLIADKVLIRDDMPCFYLYRQKMGDHTQLGLVACASVAEYDNNLIKKHELTRVEKEEDRMNHILHLNAHTGPVFLTYLARPGITAFLERLAGEKPEYDFTSPDDISHTLWSVRNTDAIRRIEEDFQEIPEMYVADGHHRSAAASRVAHEKREENPAHTGEEEYNFFLSVIFPHNQMQILAYNRVVSDLNSLSVDVFLEKISQKFLVRIYSDSHGYKPSVPHDFGMYLKDKWYRLSAIPGTWDENSPTGRLDVSILAENLLGPVLGIGDPRTDRRIDFVGGIRGLEELGKRVDTGEMAVAFSLYPTRIEDLLAIADAGEIMPPKSTWFEPKLRSGLVVHLLD